MILLTIILISRYQVVVLEFSLMRVLRSFQDHIHGVRGMVVLLYDQVVIDYQQLFGQAVIGALIGSRMLRIQMRASDKWLVRQR